MKKIIIFIEIVLLIAIIVALVLVKSDILGNNENVNVSNSNSNENTNVLNNNNDKNETNSSTTNKASSDKPYIPEGFSYVEGKVDDGYTIEDSYGNQYVWVPVKSGKMKRTTDSNSNYEETDSSALAVVNSVAQNYGFYVAKYESSCYDLDNTETAASREGEIPITNITYLDAKNLAENVAESYEYEDCYTTIMNSYAWDTMMDWIDKSNEEYSSSTEYGNYSGDVAKTGETETDIINNICDLAGNLREWTTEIYKTKEQDVEETNSATNSVNNSTNNSTNETVEKDNSEYRVVRGGSANLSTTPSSRNKYKENTSNDYWGFRVVLYKK